MKKLLSIILIISVLFTSCLKDTPNNDFSSLGTIIEIFWHDATGTAHGGLDNFASDGLVFASSSPVTTYFVVNVASVNPLSKDLTVTVGVDDAKRTAYNASHTLQYNAMPSNAYTLSVKTGTIKAGNRLDTFFVTFNPANIDATQSFMLPISITDAQGQTISGNFGTVYYHFIGNPLGGTYVETSGTRYNYVGSTTWAGYPAPIPAGYSIAANYTGATVSASIVDPYTVTIRMGNVPDPVGGSAYYIISANSTYSSITYTLEPNFLTGYSNIQTYVVSYTPPSSTQKAVIHVMTKYNNTTGNAGNDRLIDETFTQQ